METALQDYLNGLCCSAPPPPLPVVNFKVMSNDWAGVGVTDQASFNSTFSVNTSFFEIVGSDINATIVNSLVPGALLDLSNKQISKIKLLSWAGITSLVASNNPLAPLNMQAPFSSSLQNIQFANCGFEFFTYTAMEPWANNLHSTSTGIIEITGNIDSVVGTNLEAILLSKGWNVIS